MSFYRFPLLLCAILLALSMGATSARVALAEAPTEVAVITPDPTAPLAIRIASELGQLGLRVVFVARTDAETMGPAALEAAAQGVGAFAALRVVRSGSAIEVWIADRTTGKTVIREVVGADRVGTDADVALGAVELLRASLLELKLPERPAQAEVEPAPAVLKAVPTPPPSPPSEPPRVASGETSVALGMAIDPGVGGFRLGYGPQVLVARRLDKLIGLELSGDVIFASIEDEPLASASTTTSLVALAGTLSPTIGRVQPRLGAGVGVANLRTQGVPATPQAPAGDRLQGSESGATLAVFHLRSGLAVELSPSLRWRVDATLLAGGSEVQIQFLDERVATWGRPTLFASSSFELVVP